MIGFSSSNDIVYTDRRNNFKEIIRKEPIRPLKAYYPVGKTSTKFNLICNTILKIDSQLISDSNQLINDLAQHNQVHPLKS